MNGIATTGLFEPDILVGQRFLRANRRRVPLEAEKALLFAVLSDAIETFRKSVLSKSARGQTLFRETAEWIWDTQPDYFFSFKDICEVMDLDPAFLRRGLLEWAANNTQARNNKRKRYCMIKVGRRKKSPLTQAASRTRCRSPRLKGGWV
jgi:hypothetical protein